MKGSGRAIRLNCVDKCELSLDDIDEPALIHSVMSIEGHVDHARLDRAIAAAQEAHPIMRTVLRRRYLKLFREIQEDPGESVLTVRDAADLPGANHHKYLREWMNLRMDVRKGFPVRALLLKKDRGESTLVFTFHHSATDGLRAAMFIRRVIEVYNGEVSEKAPPPADTRLSRRSDELMQLALSQRPRVEHFYIKMASALFHRFVSDAFRPPTRVFHDRSGQSKEQDLCIKTIGPDDLALVESRARSARVELHDILVAACHLAVEKWNTMHGKASKRIRIMIPVNISPREFRHVVSNQASWISPVTMPHDRADPVRLPGKVRRDNVHAATDRLAFSLVFFFYLCSRFPVMAMRGMCRFLMITRTYVDSILFTNMGLIWPKAGSEEPAVSHMGDARIVNVVGSAPVVSPMGLSLGAGIYNRNLNISLTYRTAMFSDEKAQSFLALYVAEIRGYRAGLLDWRQSRRAHVPEVVHSAGRAR